MDKTQQAVTRRAGIVGLGTLLSRILGLVRESVIAAYFPKHVIDAFMLAFMIPNSFRRLTAEGAFSISVVSVFSKIWQKGELDASRLFVRAVLGFSLLFLTVLTAIGVFGAEWLTFAATLGQTGDADKFALATSLTRLMFPYILLVSLMALAMGLLNSAGRFFAPAFAPVLLNVSIIGCAVGLSGTLPEMGMNPVFALAIGVLIGGVAQVVFQIPFLRAIRLLVWPSFDFRNKGLVRVLTLTGPMIFGAATYQVNLFIANAFAWSIGDGAVMYIQFSNRLVELPLAVLVMAISTAALPSLAALKGQGRIDDLKSTYSHTLRLGLFVATPAMVALIVLAEPVVAILYQRGLFTYAETVQTAKGLRWLVAGVCSIALVRQTVPVFYAMEQVWTPVLMGVLNIVIYISAALPLMGPFKHVGLCMAISLAATAQGFGLVLVLRARVGRLGLGRIGLSWVRMLLASGFMAAAVSGIASLGHWDKGGNSLRNIGVLGLAVFAGILIYGLFAYLLKAPELKEIVEALKSRQKKVP